jgi:catechol 2,3-dioxygenase-like lactoylglutathione lyase family enzyme
VKFLEATPVLATRDLAAALDRLGRLGFTVSSYVDPDGQGDYYGYAERDGVHLHVARVDDLDPATTPISVYLYVDDADEVHAAWSEAGVEGRLHPVEDTDYGLREAAYVDPDGNLVRFGSWLPGHGPDG